MSITMLATSLATSSPCHHPVQHVRHHISTLFGLFSRPQCPPPCINVYHHVHHHIDNWLALYSVYICMCVCINLYYYVYIVYTLYILYAFPSIQWQRANTGKLLANCTIWHLSSRSILNKYSVCKVKKNFKLLDLNLNFSSTRSHHSSTPDLKR